ncbi:MAG TPA: hypothetical protein VIL30_21705 [Ramlibacter sp.]
MNKPTLRMALAACATTLVLAGCGGGGGGGNDGNGNGNGGGNGGGTPTSEVPDSALRSVQGLVDFMQDVIANMTRDTTEPLALGDVKLPTSETLEPL